MNFTEDQAVQSWKRILGLFREALESVHGRVLGPMLILIRSLSQSPLSRRLIAGSSHHTLTISLTFDVGAETGCPYLAVDLLPDGRFECRLVVGPPRRILIKEEFTEAEATQRVLSLMTRLVDHSLDC